MNVYIWASDDGKSVHLVFASSEERAREMAGESPGTGPPGRPFVFHPHGIVELEQHWHEHREH